MEKMKDTVKHKSVTSKVLSPNKIVAPKAKLQCGWSKQHLPAKDKPSNVENQVPSKPIESGLREKFKAMAATRPTLVWRT
jgi:hypothetical protein